MLKILKLRLYQETVCYKKPFSFKVAETYPLPPYSTVIGMFHKILNAKSGEYYPMDISIQGNYESIFNQYQKLYSYKGNTVTSMPRNINLLLGVTLIIHVMAEEEIIHTLYENIVNGKEMFTLGRNEDLVRVDDVKIIKETKWQEEIITQNNAYINEKKVKEEGLSGISYRLNTKYHISDDNIREWEKINVKYVEKGAEFETALLVDEELDPMFFYQNGEEYVLC